MERSPYYGEYGNGGTIGYIYEVTTLEDFSFYSVYSLKDMWSFRLQSPPPLLATYSYYIANLQQRQQQELYEPHLHSSASLIFSPRKKNFGICWRVFLLLCGRKKNQCMIARTSGRLTKWRRVRQFYFNLPAGYVLSFLWNVNKLRPRLPLT